MFSAAIPALLQVVLFFNHVHPISATCKSDLPPVVRCCPASLTYICCPQIPRCDVTDHRHQHTMPDKLGACVDPEDVACRAGFMRNHLGNVDTVPGGFFSPAGVSCVIPCIGGSYCPATNYRNPGNMSDAECTRTGKCCYTDPGGEDIGEKAVMVGGTFLCPGPDTNTKCPDSYFCSNTSVKILCPNSELCPWGSERPLNCDLFHSCDGGKGVLFYYPNTRIPSYLCLLGSERNFGRLSILLKERHPE